MPYRYTCSATRARQGLPACTRQRALYAQLADGGMHHTYDHLATLTLSGTSERNVFFPRTIVAFLVHRVQPNTLCGRLNRAGPSCRTRGGSLADGAARARRSENPVPEHSGERVERPKLHPDTPDRGAAAPAGAIPGQNACCTVLRVLTLCAANRVG